MNCTTWGIVVRFPASGRGLSIHHSIKKGSGSDPGFYSMDTQGSLPQGSDEFVAYAVIKHRTNFNLFSTNLLMSSTVNTKYLLPSIAALLLGYENMGYMKCQISISFTHNLYVMKSIYSSPSQKSKMWNWVCTQWGCHTFCICTLIQL